MGYRRICCNCIFAGFVAVEYCKNLVRVAGFIAINITGVCCNFILRGLSRFASLGAIEDRKILRILQGSLQLILRDLLPLPFAGFVASGRICRNHLLRDLSQFAFCRICYNRRLQDLLRSEGPVAIAIGRICCRIHCNCISRGLLSGGEPVAIAFCISQDSLQLQSCIRCILQDLLRLQIAGFVGH